MYRSILVPVDRSRRAADAVAAAFGLVAAGVARSITLLHVVEIIKDTSYDDYRDFYDALAEQARSEMDALLEAHREEQAAVESEVVFGRRVVEILRVAEERGFDLIVLQSHRIDPEEPARGWGTISQRVGLLANCPVLLVK